MHWRRLWDSLFWRAKNKKKQKTNGVCKKNVNLLNVYLENTSLSFRGRLLKELIYVDGEDYKLVRVLNSFKNHGE